MNDYLCTYFKKENDIEICNDPKTASLKTFVDWYINRNKKLKCGGVKCNCVNKL